MHQTEWDVFNCCTTAFSLPPSTHHGNRCVCVCVCVFVCMCLSVCLFHCSCRRPALSVDGVYVTETRLKALLSQGLTSGHKDNRRQDWNSAVWLWFRKTDMERHSSKKEPPLELMVITYIYTHIDCYIKFFCEIQTCPPMESNTWVTLRTQMGTTGKYIYKINKLLEWVSILTK